MRNSRKTICKLNSTKQQQKKSRTGICPLKCRAGQRSLALPLMQVGSDHVLQGRASTGHKTSRSRVRLIWYLRSKAKKSRTSKRSRSSRRRSSQSRRRFHVLLLKMMCSLIRENHIPSILSNHQSSTHFNPRCNIRPWVASRTFQACQGCSLR